MNEVLITWLISFALTFIILMVTTNFVKLARIERDIKKSVKQVEVIRNQNQIAETIIKFEARGWFHKDIRPFSNNPADRNLVVITFIK